MSLPQGVARWEPARFAARADSGQDSIRLTCFVAYRGPSRTLNASHAKPSTRIHRLLLEIYAFVIHILTSRTNALLMGRQRTLMVRFVHGSGPQCWMLSMTAANRSSGSVACVVGHALSLFPSVRRRARYGLPDELALSRPGERCLEVGPGRGVQLGLLRKLGWQAHGLEADEVAAGNAASSSGCEVRVGTLATADFPASSFDMIYMSHSVEHLPNLGAAIGRSFELLAEGGRLVLIYPNPVSHGSLLWRLCVDLGSPASPCDPTGGCDDQPPEACGIRTCQGPIECPPCRRRPLCCTPERVGRRAFRARVASAQPW